MDALIRVVLETVGAETLAAITAGTEALSEGVETLSGSMESGAEANAQASKSLLDYASDLIGVKEVVAGAVVALGALEAAYLSNAIEAQKLATMSGTTVEAFSQIKGAAEDIGVSGETVQGALVMMQRKMQDTGEQGQAFEAVLNEMGMGVEDFADSATGTTDLLLAMQQQFEKMPDGPEKTAQAIKVFGRSGAEMLEFLGQSGEALHANMKAFDDLGQTVTKADVTIAKEIRNAKNDIMDFAESATTAIARGMAPMFLEAMNAIKEAVETSFHKIVDQFGGAKGATEALTQSLQVLRPAIAAIEPTAGAAFDAFRGFTFVFTELASLLALAAAGWYKLNEAASWVLGAGDDVMEGWRASANQAAELAERVDALAKGMVGLGDTAAVAGSKMTEHASATSAATNEVNNATVGLGRYSGVTQEATKETKELDSAAQSAAKSGQDAARAKIEASEKNIKLLDEEQAKLEKQKVITRDQILDARELASEKEHEKALVHEQTSLYFTYQKQLDQITDSYKNNRQCIGDINAGINAMAAELAHAQSEAEALQKSITSAVYAQSSLKPITAGMSMGAPGAPNAASGGGGAGYGAGGGGRGGVQLSGTRLELPQQGLPGAAGMSAVTNYQADLANALALAEAQRRNDERDAMLQNLGAKDPKGLQTTKIQPQIGEMRATYASRYANDIRASDAGYMANLRSRGMTLDDVRPGDYADFTNPFENGGRARTAAQEQWLNANGAGSGPPATRAGRDGSSTLPKEIDRPTVAATPSYTAGAAASASRGEAFDYQRLAAMITLAMTDVLKNMKIEMDGRTVGQVMLDRSRNGETVMYGPAGSTRVF